MLLALFIVVLVLLGCMMVLLFIWPITKVWLANRKVFFATIRENSALGRRKGRNTWMMYLRLTQETYDYIIELCGGDNPFIMPELKTSNQVVPYDRLADYVNLNDHYRVVHPQQATVWIGWPWAKYESVPPWYFTADLKDAAQKRSPGDEGGDEYHTVPLKIQTTTFPMAFGDDERQKLADRIAQARAGRETSLTVDEIRRMLSLKTAETADGFRIPVEVEVDWIIIDPWLYITSVEFLGDQMHGLLNTALLKAQADVRAIQFVDKQDQKIDETEVTQAIMHEIGEKLQKTAGMPTEEQGHPNRGVFLQNLKHTNPNTLYSVLTKMGVVVLRVRVVDISLPPDLLSLLNRPATERAQMRADLITADKRLRVAGQDAKTLKTKGEGEKEYQRQLAEGDTARIEIWGKADPAAARLRLEQLRIAAWQTGVSTPGSGKVVVTGAPGATPAGTDLASLAATAANIVNSSVAPAGPSSAEKPADESGPDKKDAATDSSPSEPPAA